MTRTRFLELAESELEEAIAYFNRQVEGLGDRFEREVEATVALITEHPEIAQSRLHLRRRRDHHHCHSSSQETTTLLAPSHPA